LAAVEAVGSGVVGLEVVGSAVVDSDFVLSRREAFVRYSDNNEAHEGILEHTGVFANDGEGDASVQKEPSDCI
tara:strand:+ start:598 stop:816 length:219 start_codon:yes stop_codon:yes gene_type:complete